MAIHNVEIAEKFDKLANLLEIQGANPFRVRAYRNASRIIISLGKNVADMIAQGEDLTDLPGIGDDLAEKIRVIVKTGELPLLKQVQARLPAVLGELMDIEGLGPRRVQILYKKLKIKSRKDLEIAIKKGRVQKIKGFGEKIEQKILQGLQHVTPSAQRIKFADARSIVIALLDYLRALNYVKKIDCAGSFRRRKETIADLDIVIAGENSEKIMAYFIKYEEVTKIISMGTTRSTVRLRSGLQVDLRVVPVASYGAALLYFTGSKAHNIAIRKMAVRKKLKINEYGVFKRKKSLGGKTEAEVYSLIGLPYVEPELREDRGEIAAAQEGRLPELVTLADIRGDLHCHTDATDGKDTLEAMAHAAEALGYEYLAITDHSRHLPMVRGLDKKMLLVQIKKIDKINAKLKKLTLLKSIEIDILENGSLDLPDDVLHELDLTVCSIHSKFNLTRKQQTERIIRAMDNPYFTILGHPTGRLINAREPYSIELERIMRTAKERGIILELDAQPDRLDLNDIHCKMAKEFGIKIAISTDAHSVSQLAYMELGVYQGRRGWLEAKDVVNCLGLNELRKVLKR